MNNSIFIIHPYLWQRSWVFDDESTGLAHEALVSGVPEMIVRLTAQNGIKSPGKGFKLYFAKTPFPGYDLKAHWLRTEFGGNWYGVTPEQWKDAQAEGSKDIMEGWLCPALFHYFKEAPKELYIKAESL